MEPVKVLLSIRYLDPDSGPAEMMREVEFGVVPTVGDVVEVLADTGWDERVDQRYLSLDGTVAVSVGTPTNRLPADDLDALRQAGFRPAGEA